MDKIKAFLVNEWRQISTKWGLGLGALSTGAAIYAPFDHRIAWVGLTAGVALIVYQGKPSGR